MLDMAEPATIADDDLETLLQASKVISAAVAHSLAGVEDRVSVPGLRVLVMVRTSGKLNLSAVAEALGVNSSSASRTCDRLVNAGLLDRRDAANDRRKVALTLTARGTRFVDGVMDERRAILSRIVEAMPPRPRAALLTGLAGFVESAESLADAGRLDDSTGPLLRWIV